MPDEVKAMLKSAAPEAVRLLIETIGNENAAMNHRLDAAKRGAQPGVWKIHPAH